LNLPYQVRIPLFICTYLLLLINIIWISLTSLSPNIFAEILRKILRTFASKVALTAAELYDFVPRKLHKIMADHSYFGSHARNSSFLTLTILIIIPCIVSEQTQ
jgi:hypothetical protein